MPLPRWALLTPSWPRAQSPASLCPIRAARKRTSSSISMSISIVVIVVNITYIYIYIYIYVYTYIYIYIYIYLSLGDLRVEGLRLAKRLSGLRCRTSDAWGPRFVSQTGSQFELFELKFLNSSFSSLSSYWNRASSSPSSDSRQQHLSQRYPPPS